MNERAKNHNETRQESDNESFQADLTACMTVDAHQLLITNRKNMDSMHSLQVKNALVNVIITIV
jgi:hypothetical protein